jgi:MerC mercury resistance protein
VRAIRNPIRASSRADKVGIAVASLCFVHCIVGPVLLVFAGFSSLIHLSENLEPVFLLGSAAMGLAALLPGYRRRHGRISCLVMFGGGLVSLVSKRYLGAHGIVPEMALAGVGAVLLIGAHILNLRLCRHCPCCEPTGDREATMLEKPDSETA